MGATVASGTAATAASVASIPFVMGFTSTGVAAGSTAAGIQAGIGSVAAGSWFATLQSIAATTLIGTAAPVVAAGAAFAATAACGYALYSHKKSKGQSTSPSLSYNLLLFACSIYRGLDHTGVILIITFCLALNFFLAFKPMSRFKIIIRTTSNHAIILQQTMKNGLLYTAQNPMKQLSFLTLTMPSSLKKMLLVNA